MSAAGLGEGALREVVAKALDRDPQARVFAISASRYDGKPTLAFDGGGRAQVCWCPSVLEFRERLGEAREDELLVLVTPCDEHELGEDVLASVARQRLERVGVWEPIKALFKARTFSPKVGSEKWLADALLRHVPPGGYAPAPNGAVTLDSALAALSGSVLGTSEPTTSKLLSAVSELTIEPAGDERQVLDALGSYHGARLGSVGEVLLATAAGGHAAHAVPLGLAARVVFAPAADGSRSEAQRDATVRLERFTGGKRVAADAGLAWADAAERLMADAPEGERRVWGADAERLLGELGVESLVGRSNALPAALPARIDAAASALRAWLRDESTDLRHRALAQIDDVAVHLLAPPDLVRRLEMTARLVQFAQTSEPPQAGSLEEAAGRYLREGAPLDRARAALDGDFQSEPVKELSAAIAAAVDPRRELRSERFAALLSAATAADRDDGLLPVERVLADVVVPVARAHPALVVVLDGMSEATFHSIAPSLVAAGWSAVTAGGKERTPALAVLPSLTSVSRASLLAGKLSRGGQSAEAAGFVETLREAGSARLFHKADLSAGDELRDAIADPDLRVVGVVVNAIDDMLEKGGQVAGEWNVERIGPLGGLLAAAAESGRALVLAADHGHIVERGSELRSSGDGGARWRPPGSGDAGAGELLFKGRRVLTEDGAAILPTIERLRYRKKASGYHGGATPQEALAPVAVFLPADFEVPDLSETVPTTPDWWELGVADVAEPLQRRPPAPPQFPPADSQEQLFAGESREGSWPQWIEKLLAARQYEVQRERSLRPPPDAEVAMTLAELDRRGGVAAVEVIAETLGVPSSRGRRIISSMQVLLNVDGYGILTLDPGTNEVRLDRSNLETQFEL